MHAKVIGLIPLVPVADVERSVEFYKFPRHGNSRQPEDRVGPTAVGSLELRAG